MTKRKNYTPAEEEFLLNFFYEEVEEKGITPDFSAEDWLDLHKRAIKGDLTSRQMFIALFKEKVLPQLDKDIWKSIQEKEEN
ncbi:MAG: hypothetical protein CBC38_01200 [Gammaproteobacteria bacterium TMED78]|nr:MAG: hypothetical protein CBC38_01200 [Gammaproteobacteria bacterium TMED78]